MAESTSGQDKANPVNWLATRVGKVAARAHLGFSLLVEQEKFLFLPTQ